MDMGTWPLSRRAHCKLALQIWKRRSQPPLPLLLLQVTNILFLFIYLNLPHITGQIPFSKYTIGVPKETFKEEKRVSTSPENVQKYRKMGFQVAVESGAGQAASFSDDMYKEAGASIVDAATAWQQDLVLKVRGPTVEEARKLKEGARLISFLYPGQNQPVSGEREERERYACESENVLCGRDYVYGEGKDPLRVFISFDFN